MYFKKIKKLSAILVLSSIGILCLGGCGSSKSESLTAEGKVSYDSAYDYAYNYAYSEDTSIFETATANGSYTGNPDEKIITTANLKFETLEYDEFISSLYTYISEQGGYIENSNENRPSSSSTRKRSASYTIRIPQNNLNVFIDSISKNGTLTSKNISTENVTLAYVDTESRLKTLQVEHDRLLELLGEASDMQDIILLEERLSNIEYQMEAKTSTLRLYDNLVSYSTINLSVTEVVRITQQEKETFGQRITSGLGDTFYSMGTGLTDFTVWFIVNLPYIIIWCGIGTAAFFIFRKYYRKSRTKTLRTTTESEKEDRNK